MNHVNTQTTDRRINKFITHGQRGLDDDRLLLSLNFFPRILKSRLTVSVTLALFLSSLILLLEKLLTLVYFYNTQDNFCNSTDILLDCETKIHGYCSTDRFAFQQAVSTGIFITLVRTLFCKSLELEKGYEFSF